MNKKVLVVLITMILLMSGAILYVLLSSNDPKASEQTTIIPNDAEMTDPLPETKGERTGQYLDYSQETIQDTAGTKLLFFHASWCPQCREIEASIKKDGIPSEVTVFKVDYDSNQALRQKYGVTLQTTFVKIDNEGNKIASYVAYEEPVFSSVERELLQ